MELMTEHYPLHQQTMRVPVSEFIVEMMIGNSKLTNEDVRENPGTFILFTFAFL
jgi:hypothetical protein